MCTGVVEVYTHTHMCELMAFCLLPQVSALSSAGVETSSCWNRRSSGLMRWALCSGRGGTIEPSRKSSLREHGFESPQLRMLDNLVSLCHCPSRPVLCSLAPEPVSMKHSVDVRTASITIRYLKPLDWQLD